MVQIKAGTLESWGGDGMPLAVFACEEGSLAEAEVLGPTLRKDLMRRAREESFKGKPGECLKIVAPTKTGAKADQPGERPFVIVGLGKRKESDGEAWRKAGGSLCKFASKRFKSLAVLAGPQPRALAEGLSLASYRFEDYRKPDEGILLTEALLIAAGPDLKGVVADIGRAALDVEAVCFARDLVNRGPSDKSPEAMAKIAQGLAGSGISVRLIGAEEAREMGMGAYLSVARGSSVPPCFVHMVYAPEGTAGGASRKLKKIALVGKGITFDSGGLSLKPPQSMEDMKMDLAGAASVLAVFKVLPRIQVRAEVHGICAFTTNMPGPDATKPGDVVKAMNGKTVEILNTDAEGRLVLADALTYASRQKADAVVDLATLTGAAVVALGSSVTAAMANDKALLGRLTAAAETTGEKFWELPLVSEYAEGLKSDVADLRNISKVRGEAGTIIGGLFLKEFTDGTPWVHLDIAGPVWNKSDREYCPSGGTGHPVRTILEFLRRFR